MVDGVGRIFAQDEEKASGEHARSRQRDSLFMIAQLRMAGAPKSTEVRVRNLSEGGLMLEIDRPIDTGAAVTLEMRGLGTLTGKVAWCTRGRVGVAFDEQIDPRRARKPVGGGATTPGYTKPVLVTRAPKR